MAYADGMLIVSRPAVLIWRRHRWVTRVRYDPNTLRFIQSVPVATLGFVSGLGGDGLGGAPPDDWYSVNVEAGASLYLQSSTPSDAGGQFANTASLEICLYDTFGNLVAVGTKLADGRNEALFFNAPVSGQYHIEISEDPGGAGEYYLQVNTAVYPSGGISGEVFNDLTGSGTLAPGDPGPDRLGSRSLRLERQFRRLPVDRRKRRLRLRGTRSRHLHRREIVQAGWTQTAPPLRARSQ